MHAWRWKGMKWKIGDEILEVKGENLKLHKINVYYKRNKERLLQCIIVQNPENAWTKIIQYARMLKERYGKRVELKIVSFKGKKYLKYHREDGIPIYIDKQGNLYVAEKYRNQLAKINVAIRFLAESCGYKVKFKTAVRRWIS